MIYSWITNVPPCQTHGKVHNRFGTQHSILYRTYDWGIGNDFSFSFYFLLWSAFESLVNFIPCNTSKKSLFDCSILNYFKILSRYVLIEKTYQASWSMFIDLDAQYVSSFTEVFLWKTSFKTLLYAFQKILHYFRSTICHSHILIRNAVVLPLTFLVNTGFTASLYKTICFDHFIKAYIPTLRCLH